MLCSVPTPGTEQLGFYAIQIEEKMEDNIFLFFTSFFYFRSETALLPIFSYFRFRLSDKSLFSTKYT
jgi:hypothetical protein